MMKVQKWYCKACGVSGEVEYEEPGNVYKVGFEVFEAHAKLSPQCTDPVKTLEFPDADQNFPEFPLYFFHLKGDTMEIRRIKTT